MNRGTPMPFPDPASLPDALITHAFGITAASAATELICAHGDWLADPGFTGGCIAAGTHHGGQPYACIRWEEAITALDDRQISLSGSADNILRIAASLHDNPTPLSPARPPRTPDHPNTPLVTTAITRANGTRA